MVSPKEVFERMKRYRNERNELREKMTKLQDLPAKVLKLEQKIAELEQKIENSSSVNIDQLRTQLLLDLEHKIEDFFHSSVEKALIPVENEIDLTYIEETKSSLTPTEHQDTVIE